MHAGGKYEESILFVEEVNSAYTVIIDMSHHLGLDEGKVLDSLEKYRTKQRLWEGDGICQACHDISASTWWKGLSGSEALAPLASIILQIPPTSAASERNRSVFRNAYARLCNRQELKYWWPSGQTYGSLSLIQSHIQ